MDGCKSQLWVALPHGKRVRLEHVAIGSQIIVSCVDTNSRAEPDDLLRFSED